MNTRARAGTIVCLVTLVALAAGCHSDTVIENEPMEVYSAGQWGEKMYRYSVRDGSYSNEWVLITDQKFNVGDRLKIVRETRIDGEPQ